MVVRNAAEREVLREVLSSPEGRGRLMLAIRNASFDKSWVLGPGADPALMAGALLELREMAELRRQALGLGGVEDGPWAGPALISFLEARPDVMALLPVLEVMEA